MRKTGDFVKEFHRGLDKIGVSVLKDVDKLPAYGNPYMSPHFLICLVHSGKLETDYDGQDLSIDAHSLIVIYPKHTLLPHSTSENFKSTIVAVSEQVFNDMGFLNTLSDRFVFEQEPALRLTPSQYHDMDTLIEALEAVSRIGKKNEHDMQIGMLQIFVYAISTLRAKESGSPSGRKRISPRLYDAIKKHCHEHREVEFYAELFCMSPKHFSSLVKEETGQPASHWIRKYVIAETKMLMRNEPGLSLQDMSERLHFPDLPTFSRYFKRETGLNPSVYRRTI